MQLIRTSAILVLLLVPVVPLFGQDAVEGERPSAAEEPEEQTARARFRALMAAGEFEEAAARGEELLREAETNQGPMSADVMEILDLQVILVLKTTGRPGPVERDKARRALEIKESLVGKDSLELRFNILQLAEVENRLANYEALVPLYERVLDLEEKALGAEDLEVAVTRCNLGRVLTMTGQLERAKEAVERCLETREKALGPEDPKVAAALAALQNIYSSMGEGSKALELGNRALAIREKALGPENLMVAQTLNNIAAVMQGMGDYAGARVTVERALAILEKNLGPDHLYLSNALLNLAGLLWDMGDIEAAKPLVVRAVAIMENSLGPEHPDLARALEFQADMLIDAGEYEAALPLVERGLALRENAWGPEHPMVASSYFSLARLHMHMDDYETAIALFKKGQEAGNPTGGLANLALSYRRTGKLDLARTTIEQAIGILEESSGPDHPSLAETLDILAHVQTDQGEADAALETALRAEVIGRESFLDNAISLGERQALAYESVRVSSLDLALSLALDGVENPPVVALWDAVIQARAMVLDELVYRHRTFAGLADPEVARAMERYRSAVSQLADLLVQGPDDEQPEAYRPEVVEARKKKDQAAEALGRVSARFRDYEASRRIGFEQIREAMPEGGALVAFVRYEKEAWSAPSEEQAADPDPVPSFAAFVMTREATGKPILVSLGPAAEIEERAARWREVVSVAPPAGKEAARKAEADYMAAAESLRSSVWDPVAQHLGKATQVFVVPDGVLNTVAFSTLPSASKKGKYLAETGPSLHYLSAERDLVNTVARAGAGAGAGILAMGNPDYDLTPSDVTRAWLEQTEEQELASAAGAVGSDSVYRGTPAACASFRDLRFAPLPGSGQETRQIADLWNRSHDSDPALVLSGARAAEVAFKSLAPGKQVLHVAAHGFFLGSDCPSLLELARGPEGSVVDLAASENPLLLSGLALAGANRRTSTQPGEDDGILTAEEIGALDLSGVEWAVLSACDTGLGFVRAGEGVFGLRRAFEIAGARTLIMSLWAIQDDDARLWMSELYDGRFAGLPTAEAVHRATRAVLAARRDAGLSAHPFHWGAFVAAGAWR